MVPRRPNPACTFALSRRTSPRMALPDIYDLASRTVLYLATKADIGPFTNVDVESTGLFAAIGGGSLLAALVMLVIIRF